MGKNAILHVSSVTGNTATIAKGVRAMLDELGWSVSDARPCAVPDGDVAIACFWCRKSSLDPKSIKFIERCEGMKVLLFGTMGGFPVGAYADLVRQNVRAKVEEQNECLGVFLCQGKVGAERIEKRRALPASDPHHLDEWGVARLTEGRKHPNETDVLYAQAFLRDCLEGLEG